MSELRRVLLWSLMLWLSGVLVVVCGGIKGAYAGNNPISEVNVTIKGTVVSLPCTIPDSDKEIPVHMGLTSVQSLYAQQEAQRTPFTLHLINCDIRIQDKVAVTFIGTEDPELPGLLGINGNQTMASGIAIGLEDSNGAEIKLNQKTNPYALLSGNNALGFQAYIAGEPDAIKNKNIVAGNFFATATLQLSYE